MLHDLRDEDRVRGAEGLEKAVAEDLVVEPGAARRSIGVDNEWKTLRSNVGYDTKRRPNLTRDDDCRVRRYEVDCVLEVSDDSRRVAPSAPRQEKRADMSRRRGRPSSFQYAFSPSPCTSSRRVIG